MKAIIPFFFILLVTLAALGQRKRDKPVPGPAIESKVAGMKSFPGYFDYYYDAGQDKILLVIDKLDTEFLYINSLPAGIGSNDIGLDRGQLGGERIVRFEKRGPKILMVEPNYRFRAVTDNVAERRAVEEAFAQSVLWGFRVEVEDAGRFLVDASDFFIQDVHDVAGRLKSMQQGSYTLDKTRSAFFMDRTRNFPDNSEWEVTLTFTGAPAGNLIRSVTPTASSVTVRQHHSFVKLPDDNYAPRKFDPRAGYFTMSYYDYATPVQDPIEKRFITRHRLRKKDPAAAVSEPVQPIIYYLDPGTPEPVRSALLDGARWWNQAFEAIGYKDAFRVEMMPPDADPLDVRYNVIQWIHRSTRGWSYGASVTDPRTGEIIKGHVSLGSLRVRQDYLIAEGLLAPYEDGKSAPPELEAMALARLRQLSAHEVGHTLGLAHSYASSTEHLASVMDYPHPMITLEEGKVAMRKPYDDRIGAWDKVAIAYGYQDFPPGTNEDEALGQVISDGLQQGLSFLSDQDARPAGGAHPYAHLWDNGKDASSELSRILDVRQVVLKNFGEKNIQPGEPWALLEETLVPMYFLHRYQLEACVKVIGGLNYRYALRGDDQLVTAMIPPEEQMRALDAVLETVSPSNLTLPEMLIRNIPPRPIGYPRTRETFRTRTGPTFDPLGAAEAAADLTFGLLLDHARAARLMEYHARDSRYPSLGNILDKAIDATFKAKKISGYDGLVQTIVNDVLLTNLFRLGADPDAAPGVRSMIQYKIKQLAALLESVPENGLNEAWRAHISDASSRIRKYMQDPPSFKPASPLNTPPGQPIGMEGYYCGDFYD